MFRYVSIAWIAFLIAATPAVGQEPTAETTDQEPPRDTINREPMGELTTTPSAHDWEFALAASDRAPEATGSVLVTEDDADRSFVVLVEGLPAVDVLDQPGRDVSAYTVWVVPSRDRVQEATLAGTLEVDDEGAGRFEGETSLETFGILVLASAATPTELSGVPVLTGIPVVRPAEAAPAGEPELEPTPAAPGVAPTPPPAVPPTMPAAPE